MKWFKLLTVIFILITSFSKPLLSQNTVKADPKTESSLNAEKKPDPTFTVGLNPFMNILFGPQVKVEYKYGVNTGLYLDAEYIKNFGPFGAFIDLGESLGGTKIDGACLKPGLRYYWSGVFNGFFFDLGLYLIYMRYKYPEDDKSIIESLLSIEREESQTKHEFSIIITEGLGYQWTWDSFFLSISGFGGAEIGRKLKPIGWFDITAGIPF